MRGQQGSHSLLAFFVRNARGRRPVRMNNSPRASRHLSEGARSVLCSWCHVWLLSLFNTAVSSEQRAHQSGREHQEQRARAPPPSRPGTAGSRGEGDHKGDPSRADRKDQGGGRAAQAAPPRTQQNVSFDGWRAGALCRAHPAKLSLLLGSSRRCRRRTFAADCSG